MPYADCFLALMIFDDTPQLFAPISPILLPLFSLMLAVVFHAAITLPPAAAIAIDYAIDADYQLIFAIAAMPLFIRCCCKELLTLSLHAVIISPYYFSFDDAISGFDAPALLICR